MEAVIRSMSRDRYAIDQSPLFKLKTKKKLATLLDSSVRELQALSVSSDSYRVFDLPAESLVQHPLFARKSRKIQQLKPELDAIHRTLHKYLSRINVPDYLHSAVKCKSYATNAKTHSGCLYLYRVDIKKFYESVNWRTVYRFFYKTLDCAPDVSALLTNICCYEDKLPTGSCLSPILSFFVNQEMFDELYEYASQRDLTMTAYVDDIVFSGREFHRINAHSIRGIINSYGYECHKERICPPRKSKIVTGLSVTRTGVAIPHKRMAKARVLLQELAKRMRQSHKEKLCASLTGMITEMSQFDRAKAKYLATLGKKYCRTIQNIHFKLCK